MTSSEYIELGDYTDDLGTKITVTRELAGGRYEIAYDQTQNRSTLSAATIHKLYKPVAIAAAILAVGASSALAAAKSPLAVAKRAMIAAFQQTYPQFPARAFNTADPIIKIACHGPAKHITCTARGHVAGVVYNLEGVFAVAHGSVTTVQAPQPMPMNAPMARASNASPRLAYDASAKELTFTAMVAAETYGTDQNGTYVGLTPKILHEYERSIPYASSPFQAGVAAGMYKIAVVLEAKAISGGKGYVVATIAASGDVFAVERTARGKIVRACKGPSSVCHHGTW